MGLIIAVYTKDAFKEYSMPIINNADYSFTLNKNIYNLSEDVILDFEILNNVWKLKVRKEYRIYLVEKEIQKALILGNGQLLRLFTKDNHQIILTVRDTEKNFYAFEKFAIGNLNSITIGVGTANTIRYDFQRLVSKEHAELKRSGNEFSIICRGQNGIYLNSKYITSKARLVFGDFINIYGLHLVYLGNILAIDTGNKMVRINREILAGFTEKWDEESGWKKEEETAASVKILFHRAPRIMEKIETETVAIEEPPGEEKSEKRPMLMTIGPSFTMAIPMLLGALLMIVSSRTSGQSTSLFMYSGLVMAVSSATVGVIWGITNMRYQKKTEAAKAAHRYEAYSNYLVRKTDEIKEKYAHNQKVLNALYPEPNACFSYNEKSSMLWNRNSTHEDFLSCRLGLGDMDFQVPIDIPKEKFRLDQDELAEKPEFIVKNYKTLVNVPILVDLLEHNLLGLVGGAGKAGAVQVAKTIAAQIAVSNCYTDVKMVFIYDEDSSDDQGQWEFARWLPHVWSKDKKVRYIASNKLEAGEVFYELTKIFRQRLEDEGSYETKNTEIPKPYFVMFLSDPSLIEDELIAKYVFDDTKSIGLSTIMLTAKQEALPNFCEYIVENDDSFGGMYNVSEQKEERTKILFDKVNDSRFTKFSRWLSNLEVQEMETGGEIPNSLTFFDMYGIQRPEELRAEERWLKNRNYDNIRGLIGQKSGGTPCYMDVHEKYHGPHGLVAGTTGSGKSETLQTYMLSLAINYSPDDIGFFIIDYKGGGMAHLFDGLPHMIGQISNLSGNQVYRAMVSIKSENRRRQRLFTESGVNNINSYTRLYKNKEVTVPIPHMFIIIDEFAELKREEPDFMKELISVAQVGRSLGVHLILATQKPSGTVDDNIWSNSKFRLCLRVQDRQDSNDMLHKPDAAYITQAGRCYLQVGNDEVFELFQSGWSGAPYDETLGSSKVEIANLLTANGKIEAAGSYLQTQRKWKVLENWISTLVECIEQAVPRSIDQIYRQIKSRGIDYPVSDYNTARLKDLMYLYDQEAKENREGIEKRIIHQAAKLGMKLPEMKEHTQLDAVKEYLRKTAEQNGYQKIHQLWMPVLSDHIYLDEFDEYRRNAFSEGSWKKQSSAWSLETVIGKIDDPRNQAQLPLILSFSEGGHHAVIGSVVSGKSTMIQTILYGMITRYTPDALNIYALDFSSKMLSAFEGEAHFGGIMYEGDEDKIAKFFNMIDRILEERKKLFRGGNYSQYVQVNGVTIPAIVIAIDNFSAFNEKTNELYEKKLIQISKEGVGYGIYLLLSAGGFGMTEIPNRIGENLKTVLCLELPDKFAYGDMLHTMQIPVLPEAGVKGRGLAVFDSRILEYQTALALQAEDDYQRMEKISAVCRKLNAAWTGKLAQQIPEIPKKPTWNMFSENEDVKKAAAADNLLPVGYNSENAEIYSIDLSKNYCYLIAGAVRTGRKNYMKIIMESAKQKDSQICMIDGTAEMSSCRKDSEITYIQNADELFTYFTDTLTGEFVRRNQIKKQLLAEGKEEEELYEYTRKETPIFILITDLNWFINTIYAAENAQKNMHGFMENLTAKGRYHNIYFIGVLNMEDRSMLMPYQAFKNFVSYKTGIHFGGNTTMNSLLSFDYMTFSEQNRAEKAGIGQLPSIDGEVEVRKIVVPLKGKYKK